MNGNQDESGRLIDKATKTPRTDAEFKLEAFFDGAGIVETVLVEFAEQLETDLADKDKQLADAKTEIERLKNEHEDSLRRAKDNAVALSGTVTEYAGELLAKNKIIEQMREALKAMLRYPMLPIELDEIAKAALAAERDV